MRTIVASGREKRRGLMNAVMPAFWMSSRGSCSVTGARTRETTAQPRSQSPCDGEGARDDDLASDVQKETSEDDRRDRTRPTAVEPVQNRSREVPAPSHCEDDGMHGSGGDVMYRRLIRPTSTRGGLGRTDGNETHVRVPGSHP